MFLAVIFAALALGDRHSMVISKDGSIWTTGIAAIGVARVSKHFVKVIQYGGTAAAAGNDFSIVLTKDDTVWAMGNNAKGQLGDGTASTKQTFSIVRTIPGAIAVAAGGYLVLVR